MFLGVVFFLRVFFLLYCRCVGFKRVILFVRFIESFLRFVKVIYGYLVFSLGFGIWWAFRGFLMCVC